MALIEVSSSIQSVTPSEIFADGFAQVDPIVNTRDAKYRPMGIAFSENGSMFIADSRKGIINYVDQNNKISMRYPFNPNGSLNGSNGFTNNDGRVTILMPHPERLYEISQYSYISSDWQISPWTKFFINAREWLK
mgnify:CR=1 FL=1